MNSSLRFFSRIYVLPPHGGSMMCIVNPPNRLRWRNARAEVFTLKAVQHFGDFADVRKCLVRRFAFFVKVLHQKVGVCNERVHIFLRQVQGRSQLMRKRKVKHRVIEHLLAFVVV